MIVARNKELPRQQGSLGLVKWTGAGEPPGKKFGYKRLIIVLRHYRSRWRAEKEEI
jgi:hypothetical protein